MPKRRVAPSHGHSVNYWIPSGIGSSKNKCRSIFFHRLSMNMLIISPNEKWRMFNIAYVWGKCAFLFSFFWSVVLCSFWCVSRLPSSSVSIVSSRYFYSFWLMDMDKLFQLPMMMAVCMYTKWYVCIQCTLYH